MNGADTAHDGGTTAAPGAGSRRLLTHALPTPGATTALGTALFVAAVVLLVRGGSDVLRAPTVWLFGVGLLLLVLAALWWALGHALPWVVGRRRRAGVRPAGLALREGALWCFWLGWVVLILFQPVDSLSDGGLSAPWVKVCVVVVVGVGVIGRGLRLDEADRLAHGTGYGHGALGRVLFLVSSVLLGLLTVACVFVLIISVGTGFNSPVPTL